MTGIAFTDCETSGLNPDLHSVWEVAVIRRAPDGTEVEYLWQRRLTAAELAVADPEALEINRYHERIAVPAGADAAVVPVGGGEPVPIEFADLVKQVHATLDGAVMVGSNPGFDASFLRPMLGAAPWHYRTVDVATLAAGYVHGRYGKALEDGELEAVTQPWKSRNLSRAVGVEPPGEGEAHTALADARWAKGVFDAVTGAVAW